MLVVGICAPPDRVGVITRFEIVMKQNVGTEDVFLGLSDVDNSSTHCGAMVVKIDLPGEKLQNVDLDVSKQKIKVSTNALYVLRRV